MVKNSNALPKSTSGKAVTYTLNQWEYLNNYLLDGKTELNNRSERSINPFVIVRKISCFQKLLDVRKQVLQYIAL